MSDDWAKRISTLRRLVRLVSKWIIRNRAAKRLRKLQLRLVGAEVRSREACRAFVDAETISSKSKQSSVLRPTTASSERRPVSVTDGSRTSKASVAELLLSTPSLHDTELRRVVALDSARFEPSVDMLKVRVLPRYLTGANASESLAVRDTDEADEAFFDDRLLLATVPVKELRTKTYAPMHPPALGSHFDRDTGRSPRKGAFEETYHRLSEEKTSPLLPPQWMRSPPCYTRVCDRDMWQPAPSVRTYVSAPSSCEPEESQSLLARSEYASVRNGLLGEVGFTGVHLYLLEEGEGGGVSSDTCALIGRGDARLAALLQLAEVEPAKGAKTSGKEGKDGNGKDGKRGSMKEGSAKEGKAKEVSRVDEETRAEAEAGLLGRLSEVFERQAGRRRDRQQRLSAQLSKVSGASVCRAQGFIVQVDEAS